MAIGEIEIISILKTPRRKQSTAPDLAALKKNTVVRLNGPHLHSAAASVTEGVQSVDGKLRPATVSCLLEAGAALCGAVS